MSVLKSMRFTILVLMSCVSVFGYQLQKNLPAPNQLQFSIQIPESRSNVTHTVGNRTIVVPSLQDAEWVYFPADNRLRPVISLPIVLPPDGALPNVTVQSQILEDFVVSFPEFSESEAENQMVSRVPTNVQPGAAVQVVRSGRAGDRWFGNVLIQPFSSENTRVTGLTVLLDFGGAPTSHSNPVRQAAIPGINAELASNWVIPHVRQLKKPTDILPSGTWYKFPISEHGVYSINRSSLPSEIPSVSPSKWRIFAPYYMGKALPQILNGDGAVPPNLIEIGYQATGLSDGVLAGDDNLRFFARGPNGDLDGDMVLNPFITEVYYWLLIPDDPAAHGKPIQLASSDGGTPSDTIDSYQEIFYHEVDKTNPLLSGLTWIGEPFYGPSDQLSMNFEVSDQVSSGDLMISARFFPGFESTLNTDAHQVSLLVNQTTLRQFYSAGTAAFNVTGSANGGLLNSGSNQIRINYQANRSQSVIHLDSLRLSYKRYLAPKSNGLLLGHLNLTDGINDLTFFNLTSDYHFWNITDASTPSEIIPQGGHFQIAGPGKMHILGFDESDVMTVNVTPVSEFSYRLRIPENEAKYIIITPQVFSQEAERMKDLHENRVLMENRMSVKIAYLDDIYNEFAGGASDPTAIRNFLSYAYWNWQTRPEYVLLMGDADYDFRNITRQSKILVPVWETDRTTNGNLSDIATRSTDDYFVYLAGGAGDRAPDMAIGRLPARDPSSLTTIIDKIDDYLTNPVPGIWRNTAILVGDDPLRPNVGETMHISQCEDLDNRLPNSFITHKIYLTEYPDVQDPTSAYVRKPDAREDLLQKIYDGAVIVTYMGHGSPTVWAQERVFTQSDLPRLNTSMKLPFWVAGTCDWGYFDDVNSNCVPETILNMRGDGGIGILTATRKVGSFSNATLMRSVYEGLFQYNDRSLSNSLGKAIVHAKAFGSFNAMNDEKYILFADPALILASPRDKGALASVTPSTPKALGKLTYSGSVQNSDDAAPISGQAVVTAFDAKRNVTRHYSGYVPNTSQGFYEGDISYTLPGERIFRGLISVDNGSFSGQFTIPKDIRYAGRTGILNVQYWDNAGQSGVAYVDTLSFTGSDSTVSDETGPDIQFFYFGQPLMNGRQILGGDNLTIELSDANGINLTGVAGHGISLAIDEDWTTAVDVTELFEYNIDRADLGQLNVALSNIEKGTHTISVKAWDNYNNPSVSNISLNFTSSSEFRIVDVYNYPNPMDRETTFWFRLTDAADVSLSIYSLGGRKLRKLDLGNLGRGYATQAWDGRDEFGQLLANGVYLVVVEGKTDLTSDPVQTIQKLVIAR